MTSDFEQISEHQLKLVLFKMALLIAIIAIFLGAAVSAMTGAFMMVAANALMFTFAFFMLAQAGLTMLHIIDWFEKRKVNRHG